MLSSLGGSALPAHRLLRISSLFRRAGGCVVGWERHRGGACAGCSAACMEVRFTSLAFSWPCCRTRSRFHHNFLAASCQSLTSEPPPHLLFFPRRAPQGAVPIRTPAESCTPCTPAQVSTPVPVQVLLLMCMCGGYGRFLKNLNASAFCTKASTAFTPAPPAHAPSCFLACAYVHCYSHSQPSMMTLIYPDLPHAGACSLQASACTSPHTHAMATLQDGGAAAGVKRTVDVDRSPASATTTTTTETEEAGLAAAVARLQCTMEQSIRLAQVQVLQQALSLLRSGAPLDHHFSPDIRLYLPDMLCAFIRGEGVLLHEGRHTAYREQLAMCVHTLTGLRPRLEEQAHGWLMHLPLV